MLEPRNFNACKNTAVPMIVILGHLEINMEVSNAGIETTDSNNYKEISRDNGDANGMLATM